MSFRVLLFVFVSKLLCTSADDYGLGSIFPELKIKEAGPSQQYNWIGYTPHFPKTVPRPLLRYTWQPYEDPTYTAFWVSEKDNELGSEYRDVSGEIHHGFGEPKPSSIKGGALLDHFNGPSDVYQGPDQIDAISIGDTYLDPNALVTDYDGSFGVDESYGKANEGSFETPSQVFEASPVIHAVEGDFGGNAGGSYQEIAVGHQDSHIEAGQLIHQEQYAGESNYQPVIKRRPQIVPFVKPPHSEPLPLENEDTYQVLKRSPKEQPKELLKESRKQTPKEPLKKSN